MDAEGVLPYQYFQFWSLRQQCSTILGSVFTKDAKHSVKLTLVDDPAGGLGPADAPQVRMLRISRIMYVACGIDWWRDMSSVDALAAIR